MAAQTAVRKQESNVRRAEPARSGRVYTPPVDIVEQPDGLLLLADVPGVDGSDIDIQYENGLLTIHGKVKPRQQDRSRCLLCEYGVGDYYRSFTIGEGIDANRIEAELREGVMRLHLPKSEALKPRKIAVKGG